MKEGKGGGGGGAGGAFEDILDIGGAVACGIGVSNCKSAWLKSQFDSEADRNGVS
jgi:hypothetical protein